MSKVYSYVTVPWIKGKIALYSESDEKAFLKLIGNQEHSIWYYNKPKEC